MNPSTEEWKGLTLDEIRMRRLLTLTRIEIDKAHLQHLTNNYTSSGKISTSTPIMRKLTGALDYMDYGVLAFRLGKSIFKLFHRKKK